MPATVYQANTESQAMQGWPVDSQELVKRYVFGLTLNRSISKMWSVSAWLQETSALFISGSSNTA